MSTADDKLAAIATQLKTGLSAPTETVRAFLGWFGAARRGWRVTTEIREALAAHKIETDPDFETAYIDGTIRFKKAAGDRTATGDEMPAPTEKLSRLEAANRPPVSVKPDDPLEKAVTIMLDQQFSQLPVMTSERDVRGIVSWRTIGSRLAVKRECKFARECMEDAEIVSAEEPLFTAIAKISADDCILVRALDKTICGIVTASDLSLQFRLLAEPFLLVGEIERWIRYLLHGKFSAEELQALRAPGMEARPVTDLSSLTFGDYVRLLQDPDGWNRLGLTLDRAHFCGRLERIRELRNDIMHFSPDGLEPADMDVLRKFASLLRSLNQMKAI